MKYSTTDNFWFKQRLVGVVYIIFILFLILTIRLYYLQMINGSEYRNLSDNNCIRLQRIRPPRGLIFDRNGTLLVENRPSFDIELVLKDAKPLNKTIKHLANYLQLPEDEILSKVDRYKSMPSYKPIPIKHDIDWNTLAVIEANRFNLPGISINVTPTRFYINDYSAAHLLGYLSEINTNELSLNKYQGLRLGDFVGRYGVEKAYEKYLQGEPGGRQVEVNSIGQVVKVLKTVHTNAGNNIVLTIDQQLQLKAEELLKGKVGAVAAMDPSTGEILVMASNPSFNQNAFVTGFTGEQWRQLISDSARPMENKVIQAEYPPASTYKIVTALAGLEEGVVDEHSTFFCPGYLNFGNRPFRCWKKWGHGTTNVFKALAESCDVYFYHVGIKLGVDRLAWYAKACGLNSPTGILLDHESKGLIPSALWKMQRFKVPWQRGETLSIAIGQGYNLVTPIQMLVLVSAIGNGGTRYKPILHKSILNAEGKEIAKESPQILGKLPVSKSHLQYIQRGLWEVVNTDRGTAHSTARLQQIEICGKTGTAQVFSQTHTKELKEEKSHAWFVAYAPATNPKIAVVVMIEHGEHGSSAAAPIAKEIIKAALEKH
ncbi:MAG: penicillin-binding protein 2 [Desulfobacterales bacterium]|nr:penicillin-binding protein 2 [Desulfobacterales bacterium]